MITHLLITTGGLLGFDLKYQVDENYYLKITVIWHFELISNRWR
jgi:hypothetical protein